MSVAQEKFSKLNQVRKTTAQQIGNNISQLNTLANDVMRQQAYMRKDPDGNSAGDLLPIVEPDFLALVAAFNEVSAKLEDVKAVHAGTMTPDELIAKYSLDLIEFSNGLI